MFCTEQTQENKASSEDVEAKKQELAKNLLKPFGVQQKNLTIGLELEEYTVDDHGNPIHGLEILREELGDPSWLHEETYSCQVELVTPPAKCPDEALNYLFEYRGLAERALARHGAKFAGRAIADPNWDLSGFIHSSDRLAQNKARGINLQRLSTCGFHIHLGGIGRDRVLKMRNQLENLIPHIAIITANSPGLINGRRCISKRLNQWAFEMATGVGLGHKLNTPVEYASHIFSHRGMDLKDAYLICRLSKFGTVEIRAADTSSHAAIARCTEFVHQMASKAITDQTVLSYTESPLSELKRVLFSDLGAMRSNWSLAT